MTRAKAGRATKQALGQFMTPPKLAEQVVTASGLKWSTTMKVLEPGFGAGAFLFQAIEGILAAHGSRSRKTIERVFADQIYGVELDPDLYKATMTEITKRYGQIDKHNLFERDFFKQELPESFFDLIIGNPPYGGTFDPELEDALDKKFGSWAGVKVKKETYSFFIARSLDLLKAGGRLIFITSDTFLTINTMAGLRRRLMDQAACQVTTLTYFSEETDQPVVVLEATRGERTDEIKIEGVTVTRKEMEMTGNFSWKVSAALSPYFSNKSLGDYVVCTSGMTTGNNALFVREISENKISEPYDFEFFNDPITLKRELERARLNKLSPKLIEAAKLQEKEGKFRRNVRALPLATPRQVTLPNKDYKFYNKANNAIVYAQPSSVIFWKDNGDAVLTYKKNGNWYLNGVGGQKFFTKEGMTWQLVAPKINMKYLPEGYILDSGAPCGFLRDGVAKEEFWLIFGWCLTDKATEILKTVINHTRNIQGKDIERLPYPHWLSSADRARAIEIAKSMVERAVAGEVFDRSSTEIAELNKLYTLTIKV